MITTIGTELINEVLPEEFRRASHDLDKKGSSVLLDQLAEKYPDSYAQIVQKLTMIGHRAAQATGSAISLAGLRKSPELRIQIARIQHQVSELNRNAKTPAEAKAAVVQYVSGQLKGVQDKVFDPRMAAGDPMALQVISGSRGNKGQLQQLVAGDGLVADHKGDIIPVPVLNGYAQGLSPAEYFAASYGARMGSVSVKLGTAQGGYLGKQLFRAAHNLVVTEDDCGTEQFISADPTDRDSIGAVTSDGKIVTSSMLQGDKPLKIRSAMTCQAKSGICGKCAGARERGGLPEIGDTIGITAAQALGERIAQGMLGAKHTGGQVSGEKDVESGASFIERVLQSPTNFLREALVAPEDGTVTGIRPAEQGGTYVEINGVQHHLEAGLEPTVKVGDKFEQGDVLSSGTPSPRALVEARGVSEGRKYMVDVLRRAAKSSGIPVHRRNLEVLARGAINHVRITGDDGIGDFLPGDVAEYDDLVSDYEPREGSAERSPSQVRGQFLEKPVAGYGIGTRLTGRVIKDLTAQGIPTVLSHAEPPPFEHTYVPMRDLLSQSSNWLTQMGGSYLEKNFTDAVARGASADTKSTSFYGGLALGGQDFGKSLKTEGKF